MALNLVMLGPPGAGKGTQAVRVEQERGIPQVSTGDILREAVQAGTDLGRQAQAVMERGELVSDALIVEIVRERLARDDTRGGFILDGFPRTVAQAEALDEILAGRDPLIVVELSVPDQPLVQRLSRRRVCRDCGATYGAGAGEVPAACRRCGAVLVARKDDREEVVRERLRVYREQTEPLVELYRDRPSFRRVDGNQPAAAVRIAMAGAIDAARAAVRVQSSPAV